MKCWQNSATSEETEAFTLGITLDCITLKLDLGMPHVSAPMVLYRGVPELAIR